MGVKSVLPHVDLASFLSYAVLILKFIRAEGQKYSSYTIITVVVSVFLEVELALRLDTVFIFIPIHGAFIIFYAHHKMVVLQFVMTER